MARWSLSIQAWCDGWSFFASQEMPFLQLATWRKLGCLKPLSAPFTEVYVVYCTVELLICCRKDVLQTIFLHLTISMKIVRGRLKIMAEFLVSYCLLPRLSCLFVVHVLCCSLEPFTPWPMGKPAWSKWQIFGDSYKNPGKQKSNLSGIDGIDV